MRVLVVGATSWNLVLHVDRLPEPRPHAVVATESYPALGGTAAGKALNLARLGHEVHLHTLLGDDEPGDRARDVLERGGVVVHADAEAHGTEQHVNLMAADGGRLSVYRSVTTPRDDLDLRPVVALAADCDAVVLNLTDYVRRLVPDLAARRIAWWTDLHDWDGTDSYHRDFLAADSIVLSADALPPAGLRDSPVLRGLAAGGRLVVCTRGAQGALALRGEDVVEVAAYPVATVVDTNGAGDAFTAGLLHGLDRGWPLPRSLAAGAVAGALAVTSRALASEDLTAELVERDTAGPVSPSG